MVKWLNSIIVLLFTTCLLLGIWIYLCNPQRFPVKNVQLKVDADHIPINALQQIITPYVEKGFFALSGRALSQQLKQIPWVDDVMIQRVWPSSLVVTVVERKPIACWNQNQLIDNQGRLFQPPTEGIPTGLPSLSGPSDQMNEVWQTYQAFNQIFSPIKQSIVSITETGRHAWQLQLNTGATLMLGRNDLNQRLMRYAQAFPLLMAQNNNTQPLVVDLRYTDGFAVQWPAGTAITPSDQPPINKSPIND